MRFLLYPLSNSDYLSKLIDNKQTFIITNKGYYLFDKTTPLSIKRGDIFTTCYNLGLDIPLLDHISQDNIITDINNKKVSKNLRDFINSHKDISYNFILDIYDNKPVFKINCYITDLFIYDLISIISDNNIGLRICSKCKRLFIKSHNNQAWCDDCLKSDKSRKVYQSDYYIKHSQLGTSDNIKRILKGRLNKRYQNNLNDPYYLHISDTLVNKCSNDYNALNKLNALDFIEEYSLPVYVEYMGDNSNKTSIDELHKDIINKCNDISTLEAWYIGIFKRLPNRERDIFMNKINVHALNNGRVNDYNKQAIKDELSILLNSK